MLARLPERIAPSAAHRSRYFPRAYAGGAGKVSPADRRFTTRPAAGPTRGSPAMVAADRGWTLMKTLITALALSLPLIGFAQTPSSDAKAATEKAASDTKAATEKAASDTKATADKAAADTSAAASQTKKKAKHSAKKAADETKAAGEAVTK